MKLVQIEMDHNGEMVTKMNALGRKRLEGALPVLKALTVLDGENGSPAASAHNSIESILEEYKEEEAK